MGAEVADEADEASRNLWSISPALVGPMDVEPAVSTLDRAPVEELLAPAEQEEAKAPGSPAVKGPSLFTKVFRTLRRAFCSASSVAGQ